MTNEAQIVLQTRIYDEQQALAETKRALDKQRDNIKALSEDMERSIHVIGVREQKIKELSEALNILEKANSAH